MKPAGSKSELAHVKSVKEKHPNHVPVLCRTGDNSRSRPGIPVVDKKFLAPKRMKVTELMQVIQKHAKVREGEVVDWDKINLYSQDWPLDPNAVMEELYKEYQTDDGILHVGLCLVTDAGSTVAPCQILGSARADDPEGSAKQVSADVAGEERTSISTNVFHMPDHDPQVDQFKELPQYTLREKSSKSELRALPEGTILTRAWYGNPNNKEQGQDVTAQVRRRLQENRTVRPTNEWGDPAPGVVKVLEIYTSKLTRADRKQEEVSRVLEKFPGRVAVRCRQDERPGLPKIDKKMLAPKNMKLSELMGVIRKHATSTGEVDWNKIIFFSRDLPLDPTADMDELYEEHKNEDGHLHLELRLAEEAEVCNLVLQEEGDGAAAIIAAAEEKVADLEKLAATLEKEAAAANQKREETESQREADYQHMLELLAAKEAAELMACNWEDKALRAEEAMEAMQKKVQEEDRKAEAETARATLVTVKLEEVRAEAALACKAAQAEREAAQQEATMHAERAKAEEAARCAAEERARRAEEWAASSASEVERLNEMAKRAMLDLEEKTAACEALKVQMGQSIQVLDAAQKQAAKAEKVAREEGQARLLMEEKAKQATARGDAKEQALREARERIAALEAKVQELTEKAIQSEKASDDDDDCGFEKVESVSVSGASD